MSHRLIFMLSRFHFRTICSGPPTCLRHYQLSIESTGPGHNTPSACSALAFCTTSPREPKSRHPNIH
ncbi:hypothetical protein B0T18DRAFT_28935 [Schizothecium vesticola]|uniref:Uncharacterized protein n=1 Tax=Schizothecium vesticola TaxID=314040 RepID=A0AA40FA86_9PEZI|nr:hypothetical protein B0T18DRAFT_28935 [Schizothecium vesticola]